MQHIRANELTGSDGIRDYLAMQEKKSLLRFLTCGSVDDGKSTLIGRLLYDTKLIFDDQLATLERDSRKHGTNGDDIDFALLVDGLEAEREQGITIDVAYRFFATPKRKFIVADTPGHEQYTRNMATGASTADVAVVLIDARQGVLVQTRRHSIIASLLGIRHVVLAINKIDLVGFDQTVFDEIAAAYAAFASSLGFASITPIPMSARFGDNVTRRSDRMRWYSGPTLLEHLEIDRRRHDPAERAVPLSGAVCEPPQSRLPRLCRHDRVGLDRAGRRGRRRQVRQGLAGQAHRHAGRRSRPRRRRPGGDAGAGRRGRGVARQHAGVAGRPAAMSPTSSRPTSSGSTRMR